MSNQVALQYRQGDVLLVAVGAAPKNISPIPREGGRVVLAHGEATGHSHAIADRRAELVTDRSRQGRRILVVRGAEAVDLLHEEHSTLRIAPGVYEVRQQRELSRALTPGRQRRWSLVRD